MTAATCAFPDCDRPIKSGGWCSGHYMQAYRGQALRPLGAPSTAIKPTCIGPECSREAVYVADRLCRAHYTQRRTQGALSPILTKRDAARKAAAKRTKQPRPTVCQGPECDRPGPLIRGLCQTHYQQQRTRGEMWPIGTRNSGPRRQLGHRVTDAHDLLDAGIQPEEVASRLGTTIAALDALLRRYGRPHPGVKKAANAALRPRKPRTKAAPKRLCAFPDCGRPFHAIDWCRGHWVQQREGRAMRPLSGPGSWQQRGSSKTPALKLPDNVLPIDRKKPAEGLPAGWFKPSRNPKRKPTAPTAKQLSQIIDVPPPNPQLEQMARENLIRMGAEDLLDMLGLEAS